MQRIQQEAPKGASCSRVDEEGYDGVMITAPDGTVLVNVFDSKQIKSVENIGTFDAGNPNIYYQDYGMYESAQAIKNWDTILDNLMVHFGDRIKIPV